jgi:hypothetical protein
MFGHTSRIGIPMECLEWNFTQYTPHELHCTVFKVGTALPSRYSDGLRAGRPRGRSSSPGMVENFLFSTASRPALGPTQLPIQWVPGGPFPGEKAAGA